MRIILPFFRAVFLCWLALILPGCIDTYMPDVINATKSYLVVDGFVNTEGITTVVLSRTYAIDAKTAPPAETGATVTIETEGGGNYTARESATKGTYTSASLRLPTTQRYRLRIRTAGGQEYASDYVTAKNTPPIDAVHWRTTEEGLNIYVNSHDDTNDTRYYRWAYEETWEIRPLLVPSVEYVNRRMQDIRVPFPQTCWVSEKSSNIILGNTTSLGRDVVSDQLLRSYSNTADRLYVKYSILVRQYAQTREGYEYWSLLKKNTENIGTLFDPLPAQLTGNMHCLTNEAELALGYVGAGSVQEQRIFISRAQLPPAWRVLSGYENCVPPDTVELPLVPIRFATPVVIPVTPVFASEGYLRGYTRSDADCVDCRKRGTAVRPSFWQ